MEDGGRGTVADDDEFEVTNVLEIKIHFLKITPWLVVLKKVNLDSR